MQIYSLLLLLVFITACNTQDPIQSPKEMVTEAQTISAEPPKMTPPDADPSFVIVKDTVTPYGPGNITRNLLQDRTGNIWFASWEGIIRYDGHSFTNFTLAAGLRRFHIFSVFEDESGNIWFGTIGAGVYRYDGKDFTNLTEQNGLINNKVTSILQDNSGHMWFGTRAGASRYDGQYFTDFTTKEGLKDNAVNVLIKDKSGNIWFGTDGGVCYYDGKDFINQKDLPFRNGNVRSIVEDKNGRFWFGGADGLCRYDGKSYTNFATKSISCITEDKNGNIWACSGTANDLAVYQYDEKIINSIKGDAKNYSGKPFTKIMSQNGVPPRQVFCIVEDRSGNLWFGTDSGIGRYNGKSFTNFTK